MASGLGTRRRRFRRSVFSDRSREFRRCYPAFWLASPESMEWFRRSVFSVLANELRGLDSARLGADRLVRLACVEIRLALGQKTPGRSRLSPAGDSNFCFCALRQNGAVGLGQSQDHDLGLLSRASVFVDASHCPLVDAGAGGDLHRALRLRVCEFARRAGGGAERLWIWGSRRT